jgi:hypothetical protein
MTTVVHFYKFDAEIYGKKIHLLWFTGKMQVFSFQN